MQTTQMKRELEFVTAGMNWTLLWRSGPRFLGGDPMPGSDLLWESEPRMRRDKTGDVVGRPS
jgi:hypothetical protein